MFTNAGKVIALNILSQRMRSAGIFPSGIQTTKCGNTYAVTAYEAVTGQSTIMHRNSCVGLATNEHVAALKALTEWLERAVVKANVSRFPHGTDGVAGWDVSFPFLRKIAAKKARLHALGEACERYIWSKWWDDTRFSHEVLAGQALMQISSPETVTMADFVKSLFGGGELIAIRPKSSSEFPCELTIGAFLLPSGDGLITGGAAANKGQEKAALTHGMTELLRHAVALKRAREGGVVPQTIYEKRLMWMASADGLTAFNARLASKAGGLDVAFPGVAIDEPVADKCFPFAVFHHFNFRDHPQFIGSVVERACL